MSRKLLANPRFWVLGTSIGLALSIYFCVLATVSSSSLQISKLTQSFALFTLLFLFITLLISPLYAAFPKLPYRSLAVLARRPLGVATFFFAATHATIAFFFQLGGFAGLPFLSTSYLIAISLSTVALIILALLAATSFDSMVRRLGKRWKQLHRLVYLAGILILIHALMLGSHFSDLPGSLIAKASFFFLGVLLLLEAMRLDRFLERRSGKPAQFGPILLIVACLLVVGLSFFSAGTTAPTLSTHAQHIQQAQSAQQPAATLPGISGDSSKRYSVGFNHPENLSPGQDETLDFTVTNAATGEPTSLYTKVYTQFAHLVIVDDQLTYFSHVHPGGTRSGFSMTASFPHPGGYHLYLDFQPLGAIEQQFAFTVRVGDGGTDLLSKPAPDTSTTKNFGQYTVSLSPNGPLSASALSVGNQLLSFTLNHSDGSPVTTLATYLGAFGHLVMINEDTYEYIHVHPAATATPPPSALGGPTVQFQPLGLYGAIKPGIYRVFAQFNPGGTLMVADYTVTIR